MKKNKNRCSFNSIFICSLIVSVASIPNANAADQTPEGHQDKIGRCTTQRTDCLNGAKGKCNEGGISEMLGVSPCVKKEKKTCRENYSSCMGSYRAVDGSNKPIFTGQDAYINPVSGSNNGSPRIPAKSIAPMNKSLANPLVVPTKKTIAKPMISRSQTRSMSTPIMQPKQRVEPPAKRKVVTTSSSTIPKNKKTIKPTARTTSKGTKQKSNQPSIRKTNSTPEINSGKLKFAPATSNNFDEADSIFGKRTSVPNSQAR